jgi:hypothetical protein
MRPELAVLSSALVVVLMGCGGNSQPRLAHADAAQLISLTERIPHEDACAQTRDIADVSARAVQLVDRGRVPADLREPLLAGVNALAAHAPSCVQTVPTTPVPPAKPQHGHDNKHHHHGKHGNDGNEG